MTDQEFLNKIKPDVIQDMHDSGILASLTAAQAFIESNRAAPNYHKSLITIFLASRVRIMARV